MNDKKIISDPAIMLGKPVIAGTRITVELILESYPHLTREGILAALEYAARVFEMDTVYPFPKKAA